MSRRERTPRAHARKPHRTWPQRLLITFNVMCIVVALAGAGSLAYAKRQVSQVKRVEVAQVSGFVSGEELTSDEPRNFLIVGADSDDGLSADDAAVQGRGSVGGIRSDTIMVVRVDPKSGEAKILSFPRDLWVDIPGNSKNRINSSLEFGGQDLLIATIKANFGIDINHYVQINFAGFKSMVDLLGGVPVYFETPVKDQGGLNVVSPGCNTLDADGALAYVRARHMKYQNENGRWVSLDGTSDLGRISRQQDFIKRVLRGAIKKGARNPVTMANLVNVGVKNLTLDQNTTGGDLIALGKAFRNFDPNSLRTYSVPATRAFKGGADVLEVQAAKAEPIFELFRGTGIQAADGELSPATIAVQVVNASGTQNQAAEASGVLATVGFKMVPPTSGEPVMRTEVRYPKGMEAQAALVARHLFADVNVVADMDVAQVTVVTGPDFRSALLDARPASDFAALTTTTTAPVASTVPGQSSTSGSSSSTTAAPTTTTPEGQYVPGTVTSTGEACG